MIRADFDWSLYLTLAESLANSESEEPLMEAQLRCAISRAYYAAFNKTRRYSEDHLNYQASERDQHVHLANFIGEIDDRDARRMSSNLSTLRQMRRKADYICGYDGRIENDATYAIQTAKRVIDVLDNQPFQ